MKINNIKVEKIRIEHMGNKMQEIHIFNPLPPYTSMPDVKEQKEASIYFDDLYEVKELINILQEFNKRCEDHIGKWEDEK
jgi:hypothetical protein